MLVYFWPIEPPFKIKSMNIIRPPRSIEKWDVQKVRLLKQYKSLSENDLKFEAGRKFEMIARVSEKLGIPEADMKRIFDKI